jgi:adenosine deaminase
MYLDLHVHLRGTVFPEAARHLGVKQGTVLDSSIFDQVGRYCWNGFSGFLQTYDSVASLIRTKADLERIAYDYLATSAAKGVIYVEFMISPPDLSREGVPYSDQLAALISGGQRAMSDFGIESRLIATCVRHLGPEAARQAAEMIVSERDPYVVGFGMTGNEFVFDAKEFAPAFHIAERAGLRLTAHAGEHREAHTVREAVDFLRLDRVGHGVRAIEDKSVSEYLASKGTGLEICISSNLALGLYASINDHPFKTLRAAGLKLCIGTDDPAFFRSSCDEEYNLAAANAKLNRSDLIKLSRDAISLAFCDKSTKARLHQRIDSVSA